MSQTITDITITPLWQSINTLTGISVGTSMQIDSKTLTQIILAEGTQPAADSTDGVPLTTYNATKSSKIVSLGSLEIWARTESDTGVGSLSVQGV